MTIDVDNEVASKPAAQTAEQELTNPLHLLQQAIANMPDIDPAKVQAVLNKLENGGLQIMGSDAERLESAQRIAQKIIDESSE